MNAGCPELGLTASCWANIDCCILKWCVGEKFQAASTLASCNNLEANQYADNTSCDHTWRHMTITLSQLTLTSSSITYEFPNLTVWRQGNALQFSSTYCMPISWAELPGKPTFDKYKYLPGLEMLAVEQV